MSASVLSTSPCTIQRERPSAAASSAVTSPSCSLAAGKHGAGTNFCRSGRTNLGQGDKSVSTKDAIPLVKPFLEGMEGRGYSTPLHFCVDERGQKNRTLAEMLAAETGIEGKGGYALEWCVAALEAEGGDLDRGRSWLKGWAPQRSESAQ